MIEEHHVCASPITKHISDLLTLELQGVEVDHQLITTPNTADVQSLQRGHVGHDQGCTLVNLELHSLHREHGGE